MSWMNTEMVYSKEWIGRMASTPKIYRVAMQTKVRKRKSVKNFSNATCTLLLKERLKSEASSVVKELEELRMELLQPENAYAYMAADYKKLNEVNTIK